MSATMGVLLSLLIYYKIIHYNYNSFIKTSRHKSKLKFVSKLYGNYEKKEKFTSKQLRNKY